MWIIKSSLKSSMQTKQQFKKKKTDLATALLGSKEKSLLANSTYKISLIIGNK